MGTEDWVFLSHRLKLALAARKAGFEVAVACRYRKHRKEITALGFHSIPFEMKRGGLNPFGLLGEAWNLVGILHRHQPCLVHCHGLRSVLVGGLASRMELGTSFIFTLTGFGHLFARSKTFSVQIGILKLLLPMLLQRGKVIAQNRDDLCWLRSLGFEPGHLRLIRGSGVDTARFRPHPLPKGRPTVMLPARLLWDKGVGEFVEAAKILKDRGHKVRFVLVGKPDPENPSSIDPQVIRQWVFRKTVEHWGFSKKMDRVMARANIVCLPSWREGLPKSLLEGMACGRPCVTTDTAGCREAVRRGENGLLVPVKDPKKLADALQILILSRPKCLQMGKRGRTRAVKEFSDKKIIRKILALYGEELSAS